MVKAGFLKTIKNNMSFKNFFILLGLLIILSIVLFSSYNKYSIENFTPKPNAKLEIILWTGTDISGSKQNHNFIINDWFTLVNTYHQMPNIKFAKINTSAASDTNSEFRKWAKLETGNPELLAANADTKYPWSKITFPGITIRLIETNNNKTSYTVIESYWHMFGKLTLLDVTNGLKRIMVGEYYDRLYEKNISTQEPVSVAPPKNSVIKL
jgi:hypothetical protein